VALAADDARGDAAKYFNLAVNGKMQATDARITELKTWILNVNLNEVTNHNFQNPWKNAPQTTMIGKLVTEYTQLAQSAAAKAQFQTIAQGVWDQRFKLGSQWIGLNDRRKAYEPMCKQLASGELK
jgi:hypothetical protein